MHRSCACLHAQDPTTDVCNGVRKLAWRRGAPGTRTIDSLTNDTPMEVANRAVNAVRTAEQRCGKIALAGRHGSGERVCEVICE